MHSSSSLLPHEAEQQTHPRSLRSTSWRQHVCRVPPPSSHMKLNSRHTHTLSQEYKLEATRVQSSSSLLSHEAEQQTHTRSLRSTSWRQHVCRVPPPSSHMKLNSRHTHALSGVQAGGNTCAEFLLPPLT